MLGLSGFEGFTPFACRGLRIASRHGVERLSTSLSPRHLLNATWGIRHMHNARHTRNYEGQAGPPGCRWRKP